MRVLQIGLGRWGQNHLRCWRQLGVELFVCDQDPALLAKTPEKGTCDPQALLGTVDAVDIVTPAPTHAALIEQALEADRHVFVEKPITSGSEQAFRLADLARTRGRILQVGHVFRFAPELVALRAALRAGRIGEPHHLVSHFMGFKRPRPDGGVAISDAIHFVDLAAWLFDCPPDLVTAVTGAPLGRGMDDLALLTLDHGGRLAHIEASYFPPEPRRDVLVIGNEGALWADLLAREGRLRHFAHVHRRAEDGSWQALEGAVSELPYAAGEPLRDELSAFQAACASGEPAPLAADGHAGAVAVAVIEAAQRSAAERRSVEVKTLRSTLEES